MIEATTVPPKIGVAAHPDTRYGVLGEIEFARTTATRVLEESGLIQGHFDEVGSALPYQLRLDHALYQATEEVGNLRVYGAWLGQDLIGYASFIISRTPHSEGELHAFQDTIYVHPSYRPRCGLAFLRYCDEQLTDDGMCAIHQYVTVERDFGPVLRRMGYVKAETVYVRRVKHER